MPLRFTLRQLEYLVAVGECGSIAGAAERARVSSPSISAAIAQLEAEFGLPLFVRRHAQGLAPTQGGRQFIDQARAVLAQAARLTDLANEVTGQVRGPLAVGGLTTIAQIMLPQLRRSFIAAHPEVEFLQSEGHQAELFAALRAARIDIALTYDLQIPPDLEFQPLLRLPPYALMDPGHPLALRPTVAPEDLAPHPMVLLDLPMSAEYFLAFFRQRGLSPRVVERTRDMGTMQSLVANGFGYSLANIRPQTDRAPDGHALRFVPLTGPVGEPVRAMRLGLVTNEGAGAALTLRRFIEHCRARVAEGGLPGLAPPEEPAF